MIFDYEYEDDAIYDGAPGESDPLENLQNSLGTVAAEDVEPRNTTLDKAESHNPTNDQKKKTRKKHVNKKRGQTKKHGKARMLLRKQLERPGGRITFPEKSKVEANRCGH